MGKTLTVIVPAFNEEANIEAAVQSILSALGSLFNDYEVIVFDDGSTDATGQIIDRLAAENKRVIPVHNGINRGFGYNFNKGVELARMEYVSILPGDNEIEGFSITEMFRHVGMAEIIIPYTLNTEVRPRNRIIVSNLYIFLMNLLFRCDLHYYTGPAIHKRELLKGLALKTNNFAFMSAALVRLVRSGHSFIEVPMYIRKRLHGKSKAFRLKNIISVCLTIAQLFWEVEFARKEKYRKFPVNRVMPEL